MHLSIRPGIYHEIYDYILQTDGWIESPIFANVCMLTRYVRQPIFIEILNVLDLHLQDQRCESSTMEQGLLLLTNSLIWPFDWHINLTLGHSNGQGHGNFD